MREGFDPAKPPLEPGVGVPQHRLRLDAELTREIDGGKEQVPELGRNIGIRRRNLVQLLAHLVENRRGVRPVETGPRRPALQLLRAHQRRQGQRHIVQHARTRRAGVVGLALALAFLLRLPVDGLRIGVGNRGAAEDMGVARDHLGGNRIDDIAKGECAALLGHSRVEDDLEEQVAQLVAQRIEVSRADGLRDFIGFLDRVWRDGLEALFDIPGTTDRGRPQGGHDFQKGINRLRSYCRIMYIMGNHGRRIRKDFEGHAVDAGFDPLRKLAGDRAVIHEMVEMRQHDTARPETFHPLQHDRQEGMVAAREIGMAGADDPGLDSLKRLERGFVEMRYIGAVGEVPDPEPGGPPLPVLLLEGPKPDA